MVRFGQVEGLLRMRVRLVMSSHSVDEHGQTEKRTRNNTRFTNFAGDGHQIVGCDNSSIEIAEILLRMTSPQAP